MENGKLKVFSPEQVMIGRARYWLANKEAILEGEIVDELERLKKMVISEANKIISDFDILYSRAYGKYRFEPESSIASMVLKQISHEPPNPYGREAVLKDMAVQYFDENAPAEWVERTWDMMTSPDANHHRFLIFKKRPERINWMLEEVTGWATCGKTDHIWFIVSVEDQQRAEERIPILWNLPHNMNVGISFEPLLTDIDLSFLGVDRLPYAWAIVGGESGHGARPAEVGWYEGLIEQHRQYGVPLYMKQYGTHLAKQLRFKNSKGEDPFEWGEGLRVREVPGR